MYLTDYRERTLKDVITQLEPGLFKKVTGLDVPDFEMLCTLGVFNASLMNDAIFKFKRYEDSSLSYTGIDKHKDIDIGGWDTVLKKEEYEQLFYNQQATMEAPEVDQQDKIDDVVVYDTKTNPISINNKLKNTFVTGQFGIKPTATMVADSKPVYGIRSVVKEEAKPKLDLSGIKIGSSVKHKKFGKGTVSGLNSKYIRVTFSVGEKRFMFPDAFNNGFLEVDA